MTWTKSPTRRVVVRPAMAPMLIKMETNLRPFAMNASANGASSSRR